MSRREIRFALPSDRGDGLGFGSFFPLVLMKKTAVEGTILALDYGLARIGVAVGNTLTQSAQPLVILHTVKREDRWQQLSALVEEWNPAAFVVGVPLHGDGSKSEHTLRCRRFARQLGGRFHRHVFEVDERYSSVVVESGREKIDDRSAALLLQQFFDESSAQS